MRNTLALAALGLAAALPLAAQEKFPSRPIEFIVPFGPGGGADQLARKMARLLEPELKVSVPVVNVPGATGGTGMAKLVAGNKPTILELMVTQELGDPFRRDALKKPKRLLDKYKEYTVA